MRYKREKNIKKMRLKKQQKKRFTTTNKLAVPIAGLLVSAIFLSACGSIDKPKGPGIYGEKTDLKKFKGLDLQKIFNDTKSCGGFEAGNFNTLIISALPEPFDCFGKRAIGCFRSPNIVDISTQDSWPIKYIFIHEYLHYFLLVNKKDLDRKHLSELFLDCL